MSNHRKSKPAHTPKNPSKAYWLYGFHACSAVLASPTRKVERILATPNTAARLQVDAARHPKVEVMEGRAMEVLLPRDAVHQGLALLVQPKQELSLEEFLATNPEAPLVLLDQVTDPHNAGAILRSAAAFDAAAVIATERNSPETSGTLAKAASGAMEVVPFIHVVNLAQAIEKIKEAGYWVAGLDGEAKQTIAEAKLNRKTALVLGAEGKGLRRLTAERCDLLVRLPISEKMESLNVSNAAAVALYALTSAS